MTRKTYFQTLERNKKCYNIYIYFFFFKQKLRCVKYVLQWCIYIKQIIVLDLATKELTYFHFCVVCLFHGHEQKELMTFRVPLLFPSMRSWNHQNIRDIQSQDNSWHLQQTTCTVFLSHSNQTRIKKFLLLLPSCFVASILFMNLLKSSLTKK